jgi:pyruvate,water dikinase
MVPKTFITLIQIYLQPNPGMSKNFVLFFMGMFLLTSFQCKPRSSNFVPGELDEHDNLNYSAKNYTLEMDSLKEYLQFMGDPLSAKFSNVYSVKTVYDLSTSKIYFVNSHFYEYHYDFAESVLGYTDGLYLFNANNYNEDPTERNFLLGNINYIPQTHDFFLELSPADAMDLPSIHTLYQAVQSHLHITDTLFFYANTPRLMQAYENNLFTIPIITTERIFGTIQYQPIFIGKSRGVLKKYKVEDLDSLVPNAHEIIILDQTPLVLPRVNGVIVSELQTPLSHLVLLGRNRKIPIAAQVDVWNNPQLDRFLNQTVELEVFKDSFSLKLTNEAVDINHPENMIQLPMDTSLKDIVDLSSIPDAGIEKIGSKAFHYSLLNQIAIKKKSFQVPEYGFAIPYFFYWEHFIKSGAAKKLPSLMGAKNMNKEKEILDDMRKLIKTHPINGHLVKLVEAQLSRQTKFQSFRFRSSTNAEDLPEFNGAGLYDSQTAIIGDKEKTIEKAIKKVWASTWSDRAFFERKYFGINQQTIAMGILVHRSFPDEEANGVVVTKNIYRNTGGITVNVQLGENSVVLPKKGEVTEIFTAFTYSQPPWNGQLIIDYVSFSPLNHYQPILSEKEVQQLFQAVNEIKSEMLYATYLYKGNNKKYRPGLYTEFDLEFKYMGKKRELYIKQVRAYK